MYVSALPFHHLLAPLYVNGALAVPAFWFISGVIFITFYRIQIENKRISFFTFIVNRFSRLYPLHLLTLLIVAVLQYVFFKRYGMHFIYNNNNLPHFLQNLLFIQNWFSRESTFNGPSWSISVELFVYIIFFITSAAGILKYVWANMLLILFFLVCFISHQGLIQFNECFFFFFSGCLLGRIKGIFGKRGVFYAIGMLVYLFLYWVIEKYSTVKLNTMVSGIFGTFNNMVCFAALLLVIHLIFKMLLLKIVPERVFVKMGNLTYSMYLLHFPLQICFFLVLRPYGYVVFNSPWVLLVFVVLTMLLGYITATWFEKPVQHYLRKKLLAWERD